MTRPVQAKYDKLIQDGLTPIARWGTPADVGKAVAAIAQDLLPFSTGEVLNVDGGFHLRPALTMRLLSAAQRNNPMALQIDSHFDPWPAPSLH
jgi:hypothetical protein